MDNFTAAIGKVRLVILENVCENLLNLWCCRSLVARLTYFEQNMKIDFFQ